jgi:hypothetical protein
MKNSILVSHVIFLSLTPYFNIVIKIFRTLCRIINQPLICKDACYVLYLYGV